MKRMAILVYLFMSIWIIAGYYAPGETIEKPTQMNQEDFQSFETFSNQTTSVVLRPEDFSYLGAFRLPDDGDRPNTFAYGGEAMTFNPSGNPDGPSDGFPGSLFVMGHNRIPYGELPDGNKIAEITIPVPKKSQLVSDLNQAEFLQPFSNIDAGFFSNLDEIPRVGMQYLDNPATGPIIHITWGQHFQEDSTFMVPSQAWFATDLSSPNMQGSWYIGNQSFYSTNDYLFEIPLEWAKQYLGGSSLATGRFRDGGWSGMGPCLFAYCPWVDDYGTPADSGSRLEEKVLLLYESSLNTPDIIRCLNGYQHGDEWTGGAWITTQSGKSAVLFAGTKSSGDLYWYGYLHPDGPEYACVENEFIGQFTLCRMADGTPYPDERSAVCSNPTSNRGWWSSHFNARFILYDPMDLIKVATGELESYQPQPYTFLDIDDYLFLNLMGIELEMLGTGVQRRYRLGDITYDRANGLLYVLELFADEAKPVIHVWQIQ
jgi:hypothetical protein